MTLEVERERGQQGRDLLSNPLFEEVWSNLERQYITALKALNRNDADGLLQTRIALVVLDKLKQHFQEAADTGKMAAIQLEEKSRWNKVRNVVGMNG